MACSYFVSYAIHTQIRKKLKFSLCEIDCMDKTIDRQPNFSKIFETELTNN